MEEKRALGKASKSQKGITSARKTKREASRAARRTRREREKEEDKRRKKQRLQVAYNSCAWKRRVPLGKQRKYEKSICQEAMPIAPAPCAQGNEVQEEASERKEKSSEENTPEGETREMTAREHPSWIEGGMK